jgi:hypothetical protein
VVLHRVELVAWGHEEVHAQAVLNGRGERFAVPVVGFVLEQVSASERSSLGAGGCVRHCSHLVCWLRSRCQHGWQAGS